MGGAFVVLIALIYGSTFAPSPRNGVQPVEFSGEAYYAVLGRDLATTRIETNLSASGLPICPDSQPKPGTTGPSFGHWAIAAFAGSALTFILPAHIVIAVP